MHASRLLIVIILGLSAANARAEHTLLLVGGTAAQTSRDVATTAIAAEIRAQGHEVVVPAFAAKDVTVAAKCIGVDKPWTCIEPTIRGKGFHRVAVIQLDTSSAADGSTTLVLNEQVIVEGLDTVAGNKRFCIHCTDDILTKLSADFTRDTFHTIAIMGGRTVVSIKSTPRGARVTWDGQLEGATDTSITTFPGPHMISLELEGFQSESRTVDAADGTTADVSIALTPTGTANVGHHDQHPATASKTGPSQEATNGPAAGARHSRVVPGLMIGVGVVAIAAGVVTLASNQHAITDSSPISSPYYYTTTGPGIGLIAGGVVVAGVGGYLWWRYTGSTSTPSVAPVAGGAVLGVSRAF